MTNRSDANRSADERYQSKITRSPAVKFRLDDADDLRRLGQVAAMDFSAWVRGKLDEDHREAQESA